MEVENECANVLFALGDPLAAPYEVTIAVFEADAFREIAVFLHLCMHSGWQMRTQIGARIRSTAA